MPKTPKRMLTWLALATASWLSAAQPWTQWAEFGGSTGSLHYSALNQINKSNVKKLELAWSIKTPGPAGRFSFTPLVLDGRMYIVGKDHAIYALNAATGEQLWVHAMAGQPTNRGFNYWQSKDGRDQRLIFSADGYLQELDLKTGALVHSFGEDGRVNLRENLGRDVKSVGEIQSGTPGRVFEDFIILGSSPGEMYGAPPGDIRAYNVRTGKLAWTFHTIPHPGEFGYETWPPDAWKSAGGSNAWGEISLDEKRAIAYFPLGSPTYDLYGGERAGANLFGDCLLALDARTGKRLWHFQFVHHDLWDYDLAAAPMLLTVQHDGKSVDVVAQATKSGFLFVFDRVTGQPLWPIEERPVPQSTIAGEKSWPTQPFPTYPPPFARQKFTAEDINPYLDDVEKRRIRKVIETAANQGIFTPPAYGKPQIAVPGEMGGANWGSTAADPSTGMVYIRTYDNPTIHTLTEGPGGQEVTGATKPEEIGYNLYLKNCIACHGPDRQRIPYPANMSMDSFTATVRNGKGEMLAFSEKTLSSSQVNALAAYLRNPAAGATQAAAGGASQPKRYFGLLGDAFVANNALSAFKPPWSSLVAYDLNTGAIKWRRPIGTTPGLVAKGITNTGSTAFIRNGPVVTAGGLIFMGTSSDRMVLAIDKDTGKTLWKTELSANPDGIPAVYEVNGRQYVAFYAAGLTWRDYLLAKYHQAHQYYATRGKELTVWNTATPGSQGYYIFALPR